MPREHDNLHELGRLTWQDAAEVLARRPVGLLPAGAIEAHGPHLALETDVLIAQAMARRAGERLAEAGLPTLLLPPLSFGVSFVGTCFPGTSPVDPAALEAYLVSLLTNLAPQGYRVIALCNAHLEPAHVTTLAAAASRATNATGVPVVVFDKREPRWAARLSEEFRRGARHAGSYETSLILRAKPDSVRHAALEGLSPVWIDLPARLAAGARTFSEAGGTLGYFGNPALATVEEGEQLLEALGAMIAELVREAVDEEDSRGA
ncbi:MAG TPA: creatininase family protein [Thermomicrobiaceae bacterium]|nr:creatininase family protein [Thermomicrobiaceae bacterium]HEX5328541.1 creatininase family protein [Acetobacteraceae bacterium]